LSHDELNVLRLKTCVIDFFAIVFLLLGSLLGVAFDSLALVIVVVVVVVTLVCRLSCELLCRRCLSLRVKVLNLGLTKDAVKWSAFPIDST
jgi:hypothetical protein